jgi:hypothetical protein
VGTEPSTSVESRSADDAPTTAASPAAVAGRSTAPARPSRRPSDLPSSEASVGSRSASSVSAKETLEGEEIARTRIFVVVAGVFACVVGATLPLLGGDASAKATLAGMLCVMVVSCGWFLWALRRDAGYTLARAIAFSHLCILTAYAGIWYFGVYSPAAAIIPFGLAFFGLGQNRPAALGAYGTCAGLHALLSGLVLTGRAADPGLVRGDALSPAQRVATLTLVQGIFLATYLLQRRTRRATLAAFEEHDRVVRSLAQRDSLLREARLELAQAIQAGGVGRWTDEVVGGYRLGRVLGRGAMGEVYEGVREDDDQPAAVKLLHSHVLVQPDFVQRFVRESRIVASLDVPNVVRVLEVSPADAQVPYLAMERLVGRDLSEYLREHRRMGIRGALAMVRQVGLGLDAARAAGIVHRDLKPRNLFLARSGSREIWKILDFGVARADGEETLTLHQVVGTPNYMAPEQANGDAVTHKTDLFALGVIAYRSLTGQPAFEGETTAEILYKVVHAMPLRPSAAAPLPVELDLALAIAMAKAPDDRFESPWELAMALEQASQGQLSPAFRTRAEALLARLPWAGPPE